VAGCGGSAVTGSAPVGSSHSAAEQAAAAGALRSVRAAATITLSQSVRVAFKLVGAQIFGTARAETLGSGSFDFPSGRGRWTIDLPELTHQELGTEHVVLFPDRAYLQPKARKSGVLPKGKLWMSAPLTGAESVTTNFPNFVEQVEGVNPLLLLDEIAWGAVSAKALGAQVVPESATPAMEYRVSVDLTRALAAANGPSATALRLAMQGELTTPRSGRSSATGSIISILVWVDSASRIVRLLATPPGAGVGTALIGVRAFGGQAPISAPAASLVIDIGSLVPSGERESNGGGDSDGA
jgi:hypothetical protein